jgi:hypothetical protein
MADYRSDYDEELMVLSREFFDKHLAKCSVGELRALAEIRNSRKRLARVDKFLAGLR